MFEVINSVVYIWCGRHIHVQCSRGVALMNPPGMSCLVLISRGSLNF